MEYKILASSSIELLARDVTSYSTVSGWKTLGGVGWDGNRYLQALVKDGGFATARFQSSEEERTMSTVAFISKEPAGFRFKYTYSCTCSSGTLANNVVVYASNDNAAKTLAELECDQNCGERSGAKIAVAEADLIDPTDIRLLPFASSGTGTEPSSVHPTAPCVIFFSVGSNDYVGLRNNCEECKVIVVSWIGHSVARYTMPGYYEGYVRKLSQNYQMVGEQPC